MGGSWQPWSSWVHTAKRRRGWTCGQSGWARQVSALRLGVSPVSGADGNGVGWDLFRVGSESCPAGLEAFLRPPGPSASNFFFQA